MRKEAPRVSLTMLKSAVVNKIFHCTDTPPQERAVTLRTNRLFHKKIAFTITLKTWKGKCVRALTDITLQSYINQRNATQQFELKI